VKTAIMKVKRRIIENIYEEIHHAMPSNKTLEKFCVGIGISVKLLIGSLLIVLGVIFLVYTLE
jgi:hypothetical protein